MWSDVRYKIHTVLTDRGFALAENMFNLEFIPETIADRSFCIRSEGTLPNVGFPEIADRFFPWANVQVDIMYALPANRQEDYDVAMLLNEQAVAAIAAPANRSSNTRIVHFQSVRTAMWDRDGKWLVCENSFLIEYAVQFVPPVSTGAADVYAVALTYPPAAYYDGFAVLFSAHQTNVATSTLNINSLGAKTIQRDAAVLAAGDIVLSELIVCIYDATSDVFKLKHR